MSFTDLNNLTGSIASALFTLLLSWGATWFAIRLAEKLNWFDHPDGKRKLHQKPIPLLGGVALLLTTAISLPVGIYLCGLPIQLSVFEWLGLGITSICLCGLGLYDDIHHLRPKVKLMWQTLSVLPFLVLFPVVESVQLFDWTLNLGPSSYLFTGLFLVAAINAMNFIDGVDGLATLVCLFIMIAAAIHSVIIGEIGYALILIIAASSASGFLAHNWAPARIYLGDSGSHLLGFWVGAFALLSSTKTVTGLTLSVPIVLLSLPAFDTALAILRRLLIQRSIAEPDRLHMHHCLLLKGFAPQKVTLVIAGLSGCMAVFALTGSYFQLELLTWGGCGTVLLASLLFKLCGVEELKLIQKWWTGTLEPVVTEEEKQLAATEVIPLPESQLAQATSPEKHIA